MPYTQSNPVLMRGASNGRRWWHFTWTETDCGAADEWQLNVANAKNPDGSPVAVSPRLPRVGTFTLYRAQLTSGLATTIAPKMGRATNPTPNTQHYIVGYAPAAVAFNDATKVRFVYSPGIGLTIFGRSTPNLGANNTISHELTIFEGHE